MSLSNLIAPTPQFEDETSAEPAAPGVADDLAESTLDDPSLRELLKEIHEGQWSFTDAARVGSDLLLLCMRVRRDIKESE